MARRHRVTSFMAADNILDYRGFEELLPALASAPAVFDVFFELKTNLRRVQVERLRQAGVTWVQPGIESFSDHVLHHALSGQRSGEGAILASSAEQLPFVGGCADALTSLEVVEHLDDDLGALREYHRALRPGATLLVTVPSYQWLWYHQDDLAGHRRRYTRRSITAVVESAGFEVERSSYYFSFLVPPAIAQRKTPLRRFMDDNGETSSSGRLVTAVMERLCRAERAWMRRGWPVPFGLSIWLVARRR